MQTHLDGTRPIRSGRDQAKGASLGRKSVAQVRIWVAEARAVKDVLEVRTELELDPFRNLRVLDEAEVLFFVTRSRRFGRNGPAVPGRSAAPLGEVGGLTNAAGLSKVVPLVTAPVFGS